jgi:hypothetical protein
MGERVSYYLGPKTKGKTADWARALPVAVWRADDPALAYDPQAYLDKLDDWVTRHGALLGAPPPAGTQGELL